MILSSLLKRINHFSKLRFQPINQFPRYLSPTKNATEKPLPWNAIQTIYLPPNRAQHPGANPSSCANQGLSRTSKIAVAQRGVLPGSVTLLTIKVCYAVLSQLTINSI